MKQKKRVDQPDIDAFEITMRRSKRDKGFFVTFDYTDDALREIDRFFKPITKSLYNELMLSFRGRIKRCSFDDARVKCSLAKNN